MCFIICRFCSQPLIAEEDIPCIKEGTVSYPYYFISLFRGYPYKFKQLQPRVNLCPLDRSIREGYHSWSLNNCILQHPPHEGRTRVKCIIPKGSTYYYNPQYREYVSDRIIVVEII